MLVAMPGNERGMPVSNRNRHVASRVVRFSTDTRSGRKPKCGTEVTGDEILIVMPEPSSVGTANETSARAIVQSHSVQANETQRRNECLATRSTDRDDTIRSRRRVG